jgi:hypothetical protein
MSEDPLVGMTIPPVEKREKELYPLVTRLLEEQGLHVWEEATIRAGDEGTRTADHVAWRWNGADIEACAVEVKVGWADIAFAQAVAYEVGFPRVYVAADEALAETGYLGRVFDRVGLGYIRVGPDDATIELEPKDSLFLSPSVRDENLARIRLKHLFTDELVGEPTRFSKDRRGDIWGVTGRRGSGKCARKSSPRAHARGFRSLLKVRESVFVLQRSSRSDWQP